MSRPHMPRGWALGSLVILSLMMSACSDPGDAEDVTVTVFAASSLTGTFTELGDRFEADHPGVEVSFNFAGSSDLAAQINEGAPADVFASADEANLDKVADSIEGESQVFATNLLQIAVPAGNPAGVATLADLDDATTDVVVCAPEVPCGAAAVKVAEAAGVVLQPASEEPAVAEVLGKVIAGEADAGLVYVTDVLAAGDAVEGIDIPEAAAGINRYPIAAVTTGGHRDLAAAFVELVMSAEGQSVLAEAGFGGAP